MGLKWDQSKLRVFLSYPAPYPALDTINCGCGRKEYKRSFSPCSFSSQLLVPWFSGLEIGLSLLLLLLGSLDTFPHFYPNPDLQQGRFHNLNLHCMESMSVPFLKFKPATPKCGVPPHCLFFEELWAVFLRSHSLRFPSCRVPPQPSRCFISEQKRHTQSVLFTPKGFQSKLLVRLKQESLVV